MITEIGLPNTVPPKSSTAICAAVTDPCPVGVEAGPFMSVSTPILTKLSDIWAKAAGGDKRPAIAKPSKNNRLKDIIYSSPSIGRIGYLLLLGPGSFVRFFAHPTDPRQRSRRPNEILAFHNQRLANRRRGASRRGNSRAAQRDCDVHFHS